MSAAPLLKGSAQEMPGNLHITWDGSELTNPHILEVTLTSRGRQDIDSGDFEQPLEFRVGATIKAILRTASGPNSMPFSKVSFKDDTLSVGPGLIRRRQPLKLTLLAIGTDPILTTSATALRNVDVEVLSTESPRRHWTLWTRVAASVAVIMVATGLILIGLLIGHPPAQPNHPTVTGSSPATAPAGTTPPAQATKAMVTAEADLASGSQAVQISGISALQKVMKTFPSTQTAASKALGAFIHAKSPVGNNDQPVTLVVQTALNVLRGRNIARAGGAPVALNNTNFTNADLSGINLSSATLVNADFSNANLTQADLRDANLNYAFVGGANLDGTDITGANLAGASFYQTILCHGSTPAQAQRGYNCKASG
jgi:hypothetical protein